MATGRILALFVVLALLPATPVAAAVQPVGDATATVETTPVLSTGDAADDPAIWVHPTDPARSVVIGNDKGGALEVYDLSGARIQRIAEGFFGNVDVRRGVATGTGTIDVVGVYRLGLRFYRINPVTRQLTNVTDSATGSIWAGFSGEGFCLYRSPVTGLVHAFVNARDGRMAQFTLGDADGDGLINARQVRAWDVGTEVEGCVADDELGHLYVAEEDVGIWKYGAEPGAGTTRTRVDSVAYASGHLRQDVEGLAIVYGASGAGYLLASSQGNSTYAVYRREGANTWLRNVRLDHNLDVVPDVDAVTDSDGLDVTPANLGTAFPNGLLVLQDGSNAEPTPNANQNFKFVPLDKVLAGIPPPFLNKAPAA